MITAHDDGIVARVTGVVRTLLHRADHVVTEEKDKESEKEHVRQALKKCGYPGWMLNSETKPRTEETHQKVRRIPPRSVMQPFHT